MKENVFVAFSLNFKCYEYAIETFAELVKELGEGKLKRAPQDLNDRTFYALNKRPVAGAIINWQAEAEDIERLYRALDFGEYENTLNGSF